MGGMWTPSGSGGGDGLAWTIGGMLVLLIIIAAIGEACGGPVP
jgi:hypothetical protein